MPETLTLDSPFILVAALAPGFLVLFVRSQFLTGRNPSHTEAIFSYLMVSTIYYALALPFVELFLSMPQWSYQKTLAWLTLTFLAPAILGLLLGIAVQKDWFHRIIQRIGLHSVHVMPTAWDWKFSKLHDAWVLITLNDGTQFAGFCGSSSFISSDPMERDIYIQWIYDIDKKTQQWRARGENGVLIPARAIQSIEFWPYVTEDDSNEQKS